jgi:hypothetical protein
MKVAQYEVLGWRSETATRPGRDDRWLLTLVMPHTRDRMPNVSIVPEGRTFAFESFPALRTGLLSSGPTGTTPLRMSPSLVLTRMGSRRPIFIATLRATASWLLFRAARSLRINLDMMSPLKTTN